MKTPRASRIRPLAIFAACLGIVSSTLAIDTPPPHHLRNISARGIVQTGNNVLIAGLIIQGTTPKSILLRAIGPSLNVNGVPLAGRLADPTMELYAAGSQTPMASNDNWRDTQQSIIAATGLAPENNLESAIVSDLAPGSYTVVVRGRNSGTGLALVEAYELSNTFEPKLANLSTRGFVQNPGTVLIGGFIAGGVDSPTSTIRVIIRALGPSLTASGLSGALADPTLQLFDANGTSLDFNDDWRDGPFLTIQASGLAPNDDREAVLLAVLPAGNYTAVVRAKNQSGGTALVEIYDVPAPPGP